MAKTIVWLVRKPKLNSVQDYKEYCKENGLDPKLGSSLKSYQKNNQCNTY